MLVAQAPYDIKGAELGRIHFNRMAKACGMWAELNINGWMKAQFYI